MTGSADPGARPTLVFLHGTRLSGAVWAAQRSDLGQRYRVVTPDLHGHGSRAAEPFTLEAASDAIIATLEAELRLAGVPAVVIGLSLGGYVAMDVAARRPDLVGGLVLAGASAEPSRLSWPIRLLERILSSGGEASQARANAWFFRRRYGPEIAEPVINGGFWPAGGVQALRAIRAERFGPRLASYPGPVLIVNGAWDPIFRAGARSFAGAAARRPHRVRLARASHLSNMDQLATFDAAIERFVAGLVSPAPDPSRPAEPGPGGRLTRSLGAP